MSHPGSMYTDTDTDRRIPFSRAVEGAGLLRKRTDVGENEAYVARTAPVSGDLDRRLDS